MRDTVPTSIARFRDVVPLTTYADYDPHLAGQRADSLPVKPHKWAQTVRSAGRRRLVPLTQNTYDLMADYFVSILLLASSQDRGRFAVGENDVILYSAAPPPYLTGIAYEAITHIWPFRFVPPLDCAADMDFKTRFKEGFGTALRTGIDGSGGLASVMTWIGESFSRRGGYLKHLRHPAAAFRVVGAAIRAKMESRPIMPKDLWRIKYLACAGTDMEAFRDKIDLYWGVDPYNAYVVTELGGPVALQAWNRKGMTPVPDLGFLEFIPEAESLKSYDNASYQPSTLLLDEISPGQRYEIAFTSFHGGAFARYRPGDMIKITALEDHETGVRLPQMVFEAGADKITDVAGFSRLGERTVQQALESLDIKCSDA